MGLQAALQQAWLRRGPLACALWPLSLLLHMALGLRAAAGRAGWLSPPWRAPVPVIVVGNVVAGGAGKTPTVIAIVEHLRAAGYRPAVVSRGHGRQASGDARSDCVEVTPGLPVRLAGDEPALIHARTGVPVFVAARRALAVQAALATRPDTNVIVCDDGLQHRALARDVEIVVFDDRGTGNGWLLPAGPLREPWPRGADIVLATGTRPPPAGLTGTQSWHAPRRLGTHAVDRHGQRVALSALGAQPVDAIAGIATPQSFFDMLAAQGLRLERTTSLPDHADFAPHSLPPPSARVLLCTEKDAAKLWPHRPEALAVPLVLELPAGLLRHLDELLSRHGQQAD